jgi:hypothetical protein
MPGGAADLIRTGALTHNKALHEAEELMDGNLAQRAHLLLALLRDNEDALDGLGKRLTGVRPASDNVYEPPLEFQFGRADGTILLRSDNAPELPITGAPGYSDILRQKASWRILNMISPDGRYRVQVAQSIDVRDQAALEVASQAILPVALILPVFLLLLYVFHPARTAPARSTGDGRCRARLRQSSAAAERHGTDRGSPPGGSTESIVPSGRPGAGKRTSFHRRRRA